MKPLCLSVYVANDWIEVVRRTHEGSFVILLKNWQGQSSLTTIVAYKGWKFCWMAYKESNFLVAYKEIYKF